MDQTSNRSIRGLFLLFWGLYVVSISLILGSLAYAKSDNPTEYQATVIGFSANKITLSYGKDHFCKLPRKALPKDFDLRAGIQLKVRVEKNRRDCYLVK